MATMKIRPMDESHTLRALGLRGAALILGCAFVSLAACSSGSTGTGGNEGDAGTKSGSDGGASSRDGGASGGGTDASSGASGTICQQAANKLTGCGLSTGGIESNCDTQNACYATCMVAATCAELQGPITDDNSYTQCLSGC